MATPVVMPQMGESLSEGTILKWHKKPGDRVERDEPLFEITTDKVDTEVPAPVSGIVTRILVAEGETVAVETVVAEIGDGSAATTAAGPAEAQSPPVPESQTEPQAEAAGPQGASGGHFRSSHEPQTFQRKDAQRPVAAEAKPEPLGVGAGAVPAPGRRPRLSPAVLALAAESDLPIEELLEISGSGRGGRITKKDVKQYLARRTRTPADMRAVRVPTSDSVLSTVQPPAHYVYQPENTDKLVPMNDVQRQIAEHMHWSQQISAQVTSFAECDMHRIVRYRDQEGTSFEKREGLPLSFLPFIAEVTVRALKEFPILNASVVGDQIAFKQHVHLGIAVSLPQGLIAPVVHRADEVSFIGLARTIHERLERAKTGSLSPDEIQGATFTITSPGMFGGLMGTPMISQPQVGILGVGNVQKKPVVVDDAIAIRPVLVLALSFDHRVIDGATAYRFLERVRLGLEGFEFGN